MCSRGSHQSKPQIITEVPVNTTMALRLFSSKLVMNRAQASAPAVMQLAKGFSTGGKNPEHIVGGEVPKDHIVVADVVDSLEWTLSSPPPLHQFEEVREI